MKKSYICAEDKFITEINALQSKVEGYKVQSVNMNSLSEAVKLAEKKLEVTLFVLCYLYTLVTWCPV